jgi:hypothetical protein
VEQLARQGERSLGQPYLPRRSLLLDFELRAHVWVKMWETTNGAGQATYCFRAEPAATWDCYNNDGSKWVWDRTAVAVASLEPSAGLEPSSAPVSDPIPTAPVEAAPVHLTAADWNAMQSKAGYDEIFARVTKGVEPMLDGVCNANRCVTHWYPPNLIVTQENTGEGDVPLGSSMCEYGYRPDPNPVRACIDNTGKVWWEYANPAMGGAWTPYATSRYAWVR